MNHWRLFSQLSGSEQSWALFNYISYIYFIIGLKVWLKCVFGKLQAWLSEEFEFVTIIKPLSLMNFRSWRIEMNLKGGGEREKEKQEKNNTTQASWSDTPNWNRDNLYLGDLYHIASETLHFSGGLVFVIWKWSLTSISKDVISNYYLSVSRQAIHVMRRSLGKSAFQRSWSCFNSCLVQAEFCHMSLWKIALYNWCCRVQIQLHED